MNSRQELNRVLFDVSAGVFESLAMMFLVADDEAPGADDGRREAVTVRFAQMDGAEPPLRGTLEIHVSAGLGPGLAVNMLGLQSADEASADQEEDALKELSNVVCGNLLPAIAGRRAVFHIEAPQLGAADAAAGTCVASASMRVDMGAAELKLFVENAAAVPAFAEGSAT